MVGHFHSQYIKVAMNFLYININEETSKWTFLGFLFDYQQKLHVQQNEQRFFLLECYSLIIFTEQLFVNNAINSLAHLCKELCG